MKRAAWLCVVAVMAVGIVMPMTATAQDGPYVHQPYSYGLDAELRRNSGSSFDAWSGNSYRWNRDREGRTHVNGSNLYSGSQWRTTIKPDGSMRGMDSRMNPWSYDSRTRTYMNYGTGRMCTGRGYTRVCF